MSFSTRSAWTVMELISLVLCMLLHSQRETNGYGLVKVTCWQTMGHGGDGISEHKYNIWEMFLSWWFIWLVQGVISTFFWRPVSYWKTDFTLGAVMSTSSHSKSCGMRLSFWATAVSQVQYDYYVAVCSFQATDSCMLYILWYYIPVHEWKDNYWLQMVKKLYEEEITFVPQLSNF